MLRRISFWILGFICAVFLHCLMGLGLYVFTQTQFFYVFENPFAVADFIGDAGIIIWPGVLTGCLIFFDEIFNRQITYKKLVIRSLFWSLCILTCIGVLMFIPIYKPITPPYGRTLWFQMTSEFAPVGGPSLWFFISILLFPSLLGAVIAQKLKWP